jgi:hypothetical protein
LEQRTQKRLIGGLVYSSCVERNIFGLQLLYLNQKIMKQNSCLYFLLHCMV